MTWPHGKGPRLTFCLGMKCEEGLLAIADTRITSGTETSVARKIAVHQGDEHCLFILTGAPDVDPPLDSALYLRDSFRVREQHSRPPTSRR